AATLTVKIDPAVTTVAVVAHDVRAADRDTDHAADDRTGRSGDQHAGARADGGAFQRSGLSDDDRHGRQSQYQTSSLDQYTHDDLLGFEFFEAKFGGVEAGGRPPPEAFVGRAQ